ncbi:hypothetical protein [uncultured Tateyamaria sp.]|uniref:hypothetical protein n=1 Tax=uncultured Tateyamaria sp. TaxID=455651 RepID=UPI00261EE54D|nr:hypothetical protein [uncultured Tateyamaria sp.]
MSNVKDLRLLARVVGSAIAVPLIAIAAFATWENTFRPFVIDVELEGGAELAGIYCPSAFVSQNVCQKRVSDHCAFVPVSNRIVPSTRAVRFFDVAEFGPAADQLFMTHSFECVPPGKDKS